MSGEQRVRRRMQVPLPDATAFMPVCIQERMDGWQYSTKRASIDYATCTSWRVGFSLCVRSEVAHLSCSRPLYCL